MISCFYPNFISSLNSEKMGRPSPEPTPNNLIVNKNFQIRKVSSHTLGPGVMTVALSSLTLEVDRWDSLVELVALTP